MAAIPDSTLPGHKQLHERVITALDLCQESRSIGISNQAIATYDEDNVNDFVNKYASPTIRVELVRVTHNGRPFLAIKVPEFEWSPIVCKRNGADPSKLRKTAIYVRTSGKPQTIPASEASQIDDLLELAAEKRARRMVSVSQRIGMMPSPLAQQGFDAPAEFQEELGGL